MFIIVGIGFSFEKLFCSYCGGIFLECKPYQPRNIEKLLKQYSVKRPGETNNAHRDAMKNWRFQKKIRYAQQVMNQLNLQGTARSQVIYLIKDIPSTNYLCKKCPCETVITGLCFYVKFANSQKEKLEKYQVAREHGLTEERYASIVTKIAKHYQAGRSFTKMTEEFKTLQD